MGFFRPDGEQIIVPLQIIFASNDCPCSTNRNLSVCEQTPPIYAKFLKNLSVLNIKDYLWLQNNPMKNEILYILLPDYADHEAVYLSQAVNCDEVGMKENPKYVNKVLAPTMEPVKSIGGFRTLPDYSFETVPDDYKALVLVGGYGWSSPLADKVVPIVRQAIEKGRIVGGICNGASFLAKHGFLNAVKHTGNGLQQLRLWGGENYTNPAGYVHAQAVSDQHIVTANGSGAIDFAKELLTLLENDTPENIQMYCQFHKQGFCNLFPA